MEPEGSFLCSQEPATGLYSEPDRSNPHPPSLFLLELIVFIIQSHSKLLSEFPWPINGNPDNNLESLYTWPGSQIMKALIWNFLQALLLNPSHIQSTLSSNTLSPAFFL
jgi:hypothetical protein